MRRAAIWLLREFLARWLIWAGIELARLGNHLDSRQSRPRNVIIRRDNRRRYVGDHRGRLG